MRRCELVVNLIFISPILAAVAFTCLLATPFNIVAAFLCYSLGLLSLVHAKMSLFHQGIWVSFGASQLATEYRRSYWMGYALIAVGVLLNITALFVIDEAKE